MDKPAQWALVGAAWFLALSVAVLGYLAWHHFSAANASATAVVQGSETELAPGETAVCPVTGQKLTISATTPHIVYQNRVYYFSDQADAAGILPKRRFLMDPEAVLHPGGPTLQQQLQSGNAALTATAPTPVPSAVPTPRPVATAAPAKP